MMPIRSDFVTRLFILGILLFSSVEVQSQSLFTDRLELTDDETTWLASHPLIRVAGPLAFPPFHFYEGSVAKGIASEYAIELAALLGTSIEYVPDLPWTEVLAGVENREIDIIACAARSEEREEYILFSDPILSFPMVIFSRRDARFFGGLSDLHGQTIAVIRNVATYDWLVRDGIEFVPHYVETPLDVLRAVSTGVADVHVANLASATYLIEKHGLANLKVAAPTSYGNYDLHVGIRSDWPILHSIVNKALASISPSAKSTIRNRWIMVRYEHGIRWIDVLRWIASIAIGSLVIIMLVVIWNRRLQKEIVIRIRTEKALNQALDDVETLSGLLPICSHCKSVRDDSGYWTRIEEYISKRSKAYFSHGLCPDCATKLYPEIDVEIG